MIWLYQNRKLENYSRASTSPVPDGKSSTPPPLPNPNPNPNPYLLIIKVQKHTLTLTLCPSFYLLCVATYPTATLLDLGCRSRYDTISKLSGGELRRLQLLIELAKAPNVLLLDEPSNDLDIQTLTALEDYLLESFTGSVRLCDYHPSLLCVDVDAG
jgi:hypothetical protein